MTKRRIEREIESLTDEVLGALEPVARSRALFEAQMQDDDHSVKRLFESCPPEQAPEVAVWGQLSNLFALEAVYDLHTIALQLKLDKTTQWALNLADRSPSEADLEHAADRAESIREQFASLYVAYHGHRRFAETELGLEFATWVNVHKNGNTVIEYVEKTLDDSTQQRLAEEWVIENAIADTDGSDANPLETLVDTWYETRLETWQQLFPEFYRL